jgi:hypothetical protein
MDCLLAMLHQHIELFLFNIWKSSILLHRGHLPFPYPVLNPHSFQVPALNHAGPLSPFMLPPMYASVTSTHFLPGWNINDLCVTASYPLYSPLDHTKYIPNLLHSVLYSGSLLSQYSVWLRAGRPGDRGSIPSRDKWFSLLPLMSRPALGPAQSPVQWVPGVLPRA